MTDAVPPALVELAERCGVATSYTDARGVRQDITARTLRAVLAAMGVRAGDDDDESGTTAREALEENRLRPWRRVLPPTIVARRGASARCAVHAPRGATVTLSAHLEDSAAPLDVELPDTPAESMEVDGVLVDRVELDLPASLPLGWHRLVAVVSEPSAPGSRTVESTLLVAPQSIPVPADLTRRRAAGLAAQIYQVRSEQSWGVGDLADLADLAGWAGRDLGADFVLVNPMHAGEPFPPVEPSPYLPTTRRFASPLYLRPEQIPEYTALPDEDRRRIDDLARSQHPHNSRDTIDRDSSWSAKLDALRMVFSAPLSDDRAREFDAFVVEQEPGLHRFATWCALAAEAGPDWSRWPEDLRDPDSDAVARYAHDHAEEVRFHQWLQWQVAQQRAGAQSAALSAGMRLGILHDLAVGVHPTGADAWALHRSLARGVTVGAPPDAYNQLGQDWSQPPLRPDALAEDGYRPFRDIVRAALRDSGGIRIDHILGLFRLWWIPSGLAPTEGTYVRYDHEAMIGVLALEASRAGAVVVGEDLGTVAPGVREELSERGVMGTSVMWFEQEDGRPTPPEDYRRLCMTSVTTHDLPPTAGYVDLVHVDVREELGQLTGDAEQERLDAAAEIRSYTEAVRQRGLLEGDSPEDLVVALHAFLSAAPSLLYAVSVADLAGDRRPVNMPGTSEEYPNWRVPLTDSRGAVVSVEGLRDSGLAGRVWGAVAGQGGVV
ncbi:MULTISPECIES: 4-alpha-glucanotransferase [unclassified Dietzia]|uniref:4-alpha-glucanotransferase n=1 Tax=unclassified Dietzia TaxID=2617939 RepID=UPI0015FC8AFB|nr:4-alpha-glucanotransferase [Dietzia sp. Cai40]MBB1045501.1 4-alpha-glucanotransferase [Dietzia sp. DQ11-44]